MDTPLVEESYADEAAGHVRDVFEAFPQLRTQSVTLVITARAEQASRASCRTVAQRLGAAR